MKGIFKTTIFVSSILSVAACSNYPEDVELQSSKSGVIYSFDKNALQAWKDNYSKANSSLDSTSDNVAFLLSLHSTSGVKKSAEVQKVIDKLGATRPEIETSLQKLYEDEVSRMAKEKSELEAELEKDKEQLASLLEEKVKYQPNVESFNKKISELKKEKASNQAKAAALAEQNGQLILATKSRFPVDSAKLYNPISDTNSYIYKKVAKGMPCNELTDTSEWTFYLHYKTGKISKDKSEVCLYMNFLVKQNGMTGKRGVDKRRRQLAEYVGQNTINEMLRTANSISTLKYEIDELTALINDKEKDQFPAIDMTEAKNWLIGGTKLAEVSKITSDIKGKERRLEVAQKRESEFTLPHFKQVGISSLIKSLQDEMKAIAKDLIANQAADKSFIQESNKFKLSEDFDYFIIFQENNSREPVAFIDKRKFEGKEKILVENRDFMNYMQLAQIEIVIRHQ